jgi:DNA-binding MarR family transcriptional regulator
VTTYADRVPTPELEQQLTLLARRLSKPVRLPGQSGFTVLDRPAYQALLRIVEEGPLRSTALAKLVGVDLSVVSRQVSSLEEVGLVSRAPDPADARASLVTATEAGETALALARVRRTEVLDEVLADWPEEDKDAFVRLLARFNAELEVAIERRMAAEPD